MSKVLYIIGGLVGLVAVAVVGGIIYVSSLDFNSYKPEIAAAVKDATGRDLVIAGDIELEIGFSPRLAVDGVTLSNAPSASEPHMVELGEVEAVVSLMPLLSGAVNVEKFVLRDVIVRLERLADGSANWEMAPASSDAATSESASSAQMGALPTIDHLEIENVRLIYSDIPAGQTHDVAVQRMSGRSVSGGATEFVMEAEVNGEGITLEATLEDIASLMQSEASGLTAKLEAAGAVVELSGRAGAAAVDLGLKAKGNDIADFSKMAGQALPNSPSYDVTGQIKFAGTTLSVSNLTAKLGSSDISGQLELAMPSGKTPALVAAFTSNLLDVNELSGAETSEAAATEQTAGSSDDGRVIPDTPLPLDGLKAMDMDVSLKIAHIKSGTINIRDVAVSLINTNGLLVIKPASAAFEGGTIQLSQKLDGRKAVAKMETDFEAKDLQLGGMLEAFGADGKLLQGLLGGQTTLNTSGKTIREVAGNLNGEINFVSTDGRVGQGYINLLGGDLLSQIPVLATGEDETKLNCVIVALDINDGLATTKAIVMDTERMTVKVEGDINLKTEELDLKVTPKSKTPGLSLATAVRIGGTFAEPSFGPDPLDLAGKGLGLAAGVATGGLAGLLIPLATVGGGGNPCGDVLGSEDAAAAPAQEAPAQAAPSSPADAIGGAVKGLKGLFGR